MKKKYIAIFGLLTALLLFAWGCSGSATNEQNKEQKETSTPGQQAELKELRFFSGSPQAGGAWYSLSVGINQIFEKSIPGLKTSLVPGGAGGGPISVGEGKSDAGLVNLGPFLDAQDGLPPFEKKYDNLMLLGNLYDHVFQIAVLGDSKINSIADLKGKTVSAGTKGQYSEFWFKELLKIYGMDPEKDVQLKTLGFQDTVDSMKDGQMDALASAAPLPLPALVDLATSREIRLLNIAQDKLDVLSKSQNYNGFRPSTIPGDKIPYKGEHTDLVSALMPLSIMVRADLPEDLVYQMTKALAENITDLEQVSSSMRGFDPATLGKQLNAKAQFHPGAARYYKERGWQ